MWWDKMMRRDKMRWCNDTRWDEMKRWWDDKMTRWHHIWKSMNLNLNVTLTMQMKRWKDAQQVKLMNCENDNEDMMKMKLSKQWWQLRLSSNDDNETTTTRNRIWHSNMMNSQQKDNTMNSQQKEVPLTSSCLSMWRSQGLPVGECQQHTWFVCPPFFLFLFSFFLFFLLSQFWWKWWWRQHTMGTQSNMQGHPIRHGLEHWRCPWWMHAFLSLSSTGKATVASVPQSQGHRMTVVDQMRHCIGLEMPKRRVH